MVAADGRAINERKSPAPGKSLSHTSFRSNSEACPAMPMSLPMHKPMTTAPLGAPERALQAPSPTTAAPAWGAARGRLWPMGSVLALSLALSACVNPPKQPAPEPPPPAASAPEAPPAPPPEPPPATPAEQAMAQKTATQAIDLLEVGQEDQARAELQRALTLDRNNKLAQNLMKQITADPVALLGKESFAYTVQSNDTLSRIAGRFMGDIYSFYILARYNDIKVPKQVSGGQVLRIPGKQPPGPLYPPATKPGRNDKTPTAAPAAAAPTVPTTPGATAPTVPATPVVAAPPPPPEPTPGEKAMRAGEAHERAGRFDKAIEEYQRAEAADQPGAAGKIEAVRKKQIAAATLKARTAFAKQDLAGAIKGWDTVLQLDPNNELAKLERQKAVTLKAKADALK